MFSDTFILLWFHFSSFSKIGQLYPESPLGFLAINVSLRIQRTGTLLLNYNPGNIGANEFAKLNESTYENKEDKSELITPSFTVSWENGGTNRWTTYGLTHQAGCLNENMIIRVFLNYILGS